MNELLWYLSRGTGVASIALLTAVVVLGTVTSGRRRPHGESATVVMAVHRWLSLGMVAFLGVHVATAVAETYVSIDAISAVVPFTSGYEPFWVGLGTLALDLLVAVVATSWLRHRIPERAWRAVHYAAYGLWPMALVHGFVLGTSDQPGLRLVTAACGVVGVGAVLWRLLATHADRERREVVVGGEWT
ncbi:ferric reductase-like transmembrane domain-containing protein [Phycicoccus sonneratiae]|uniref:Ferric reductase-like transmembrane domain-containing protein n=1 Tax=Phycicoccus sonneratiae TaxID=2807628 RepID=A0ABS2CH29_9MICO|nr:ferric reductase-like transmembrane domain-containing protein [Phycicoccus sonneraticus]MBM6399183.1 ferric reductase-like transmembrane domain-containing protein [Phycicoccus sonneraticus]